MAKYRLTNEVLKDLEGIWAYTYEKWSVDQADRYYKLIMEEIEYIASNPLLGGSMDHIKEGYKSSMVKSHLVFCRIGLDKTIEIVRILNQNIYVEERMK